MFFFWKSTALDAIFLTRLHAEVVVFNKLLSEASLLHLRLLCLLFASMGTLKKPNQKYKSSGSPKPGAANCCMWEKKGPHCKQKGMIEWKKISWSICTEYHSSAQSFKAVIKSALNVHFNNWFVHNSGKTCDVLLHFRECWSGPFTVGR